jgi:hypothetical protein
MTLLQQQIKSVFPTLPDKIKDLLLSEDFNERVEHVALHYTLDEVGTGVLIRITVRLLAGIIPPTQFVSTIIEEIDIPRERAALMAQEINRDIFNPIKEELKQIHQIGQSVAPATPSAAPSTPPKPLDPLYPSFLEQIRQSTPPYISGSFPDAPSKPKEMTPPQPIASAPVAAPINIQNVSQVTQQQPAPANTPKIVPPVLAPLIAVALPTQPPVQFSPTPEVRQTPIQTPVQAMPMQKTAPLLSVQPPMPPASPIIPAAFVQPAPTAAPQIPPQVPPAQPTAPIQRATPIVAAPLPPTTAATPPATPTQQITPPQPEAPVAPMVMPTLPPQSPPAPQPLPSPVAPQSAGPAFQFPMQQIPQGTPPTMPPVAPAWSSSSVVFTPTKELVPELQSTPVLAPVQAMPVQNITSTLSAPPLMPPVTPVIPAAFVQPAQFTSPSIPQETQQAQPVTPPVTSIFEQKMGGAFVVKSDVPDYSGVAAAPTAPQPQTPTMSPVPPPQNPAPATQTGDAYREPIA